MHIYLGCEAAFLHAEVKYRHHKSRELCEMAFVRIEFSFSGNRCIY